VTAELDNMMKKVEVESNNTEGWSRLFDEFR